MIKIMQNKIVKENTRLGEGERDLTFLSGKVSKQINN